MAAQMGGRGEPDRVETGQVGCLMLELVELSKGMARSLLTVASTISRCPEMLAATITFCSPRTASTSTVPSCPPTAAGPANEHRLAWRLRGGDRQVGSARACA